MKSVLVMKWCETFDRRASIVHFLQTFGTFANVCHFTNIDLCIVNNFPMHSSHVPWVCLYAQHICMLIEAIKLNTVIVAVEWIFDAKLMNLHFLIHICHGHFHGNFQFELNWAAYMLFKMHQITWRFSLMWTILWHRIQFHRIKVGTFIDTRKIHVSTKFHWNFNAFVWTALEVRPTSPNRCEHFIRGKCQ